MLDYPRGSSVITKILARGRQGGRRHRRQCDNRRRETEEVEGVILLALKSDPIKATDQRMQEASGG